MTTAIRAELATTQPSFEQLFEDAARLAEIGGDTRATLRAVLFGNAAEPEIDADQAAVLIEIIKDMFQQRYVRTAKLRRAIQMRRFFAAESNPNVMPISALASRTNSSDA
jgi:hypothetical protein